MTFEAGRAKCATAGQDVAFSSLGDDTVHRGLHRRILCHVEIEHASLVSTCLRPLAQRFLPVASRMVAKTACPSCASALVVMCLSNRMELLIACPFDDRRYGLGSPFGQAQAVVNNAGVGTWGLQDVKAK